MGLSEAWEVIVKSLKTSYEHLGLIILINVIWFFLWLSPLFLFSIAGIDNLILFSIVLFLCLILFGPATASAHALLSQIVHNKYHSISDFKEAFLKFFWRSILLMLLCGLMLFFILLNFAICTESTVFLFRMIGGVWLYLLLFWFIMIQYVFPLLVQQDIGVLTTIKRAVLMAADNILLSLVILLASFLITFISIFTVVPTVILWLSLIGLMQNFAFVQVLTKYNNSNGR